ncbi:hypothetical protein ABPG75_006041 [Micractinium tetrahymenae]
MRVLLTGAALLLLVGWAAGCSSFIYRCNTTDDVPISGHTFDNTADARQSLVTLPAGFVFTAAEPCTGCEAQNHTFNHGVAYVAGTGAGYFGAAFSGMNSAGLAAGAHTLGSAKGPALLYHAEGPATALAWPEVLLYLLGTFGSVDEVARQFTPQNYQVVTDFAPGALQQGVALMFNILDIVPIHISIYDASGDGGVIEFDGQKGWNLYRNVSAVTNMPSYPEQLANLERWRKAEGNTSAYVAGLLQGSYELVFQQLPGSYSPAARFLRLSLLLEQMCGPDDKPYPAAANWSPAFAGVQAMPGREALAQAAAILGTVDVAKGMTFDLSGWTQVASLRDHAHLMLYWKTPLTMRWQGINVTAAAAADAPQILPIWEGHQDGWEDVTSMMQAMPGLAPGPAGPAELEELLPVLNGTASGAAQPLATDHRG